MDPKAFQLLLFSTDKDIIVSGVAAGISGIIIDWENKGKYERQRMADTQINDDSPETLRKVRLLTDAPIICRINRNACLKKCQEEITLALDSGADEILLPMVRTVTEVESILNFVQGRCGVGMLIETQGAVEQARVFGTFPLSRVYVGLNDLAIDRNTPNIFSALEDGTVDDVRQYINVPFGVAGLTLPEYGFPVPAYLFYSELSRLQCSFTFLRRSFLRDIRGKDISVEVPRMRMALEKAMLASSLTKETHRETLKACIRRIDADEQCSTPV